MTHQVVGSRYLQFKSEAQAAAVANGDPDGLGQWNPPNGYGDVVGAGNPDMEGRSVDLNDLPGYDGSGGNLANPDGPSIHEFLEYAQAQAGDEYILGAEASADDADPDVFDCSELVEWAAARSGVYMPDYAWNQYNHVKDQGALIPVEEAINTPGALLFRFGSDPDSGDPPSQHVAISLGDGRTIEARGRDWGVGNFEAEGRFTHAAVMPDFSTEPSLDGVDTDQDGLTDELEDLLGTDSNASDSDLDGMSDTYELTRTGTDPRLADTDQDGVGDAAEVALGTDARVAEAHDNVIADDTTPITDADADGLDDAIEEALGLSTESPDSDADGFSDYAEQTSGSNPDDPFDNPMVSDLPGVDLPEPEDDDDDADTDDLDDLGDLLDT